MGCPWCHGDHPADDEVGDVSVAVYVASDQTMSELSTEELRSACELVSRELDILGAKEAFVHLHHRRLEAGLVVSAEDASRASIQRAWQFGSSQVRTAMHAAGLETVRWPVVEIEGGADGW